MVRRGSTDNLDKSLFLRLVVREGKFSWLIRGPNVDKRIDSTNAEWSYRRAKKDLQTRPFRAARRRASLPLTRPVTPEVARRPLSRRRTRDAHRRRLKQLDKL
jgi:hypothetical protein